MSAGWLLPEREHTFAESGRVATLREAPNIYALFSSDELAPYLDQFSAGAVDDPLIAIRITEEIVRSLMVRPRIADRGEPLPSDQDSEDPVVVPYDALYPSEIDELLEMWGESVKRAARFRGNGAGPADGKGGADVGAKPKRAARASSRKPGSAAR